MRARRDHPRPPLPRLTSRVFRDLAVWMAGLGLIIGVAFPRVITLLGVPARYTTRPSFYAATIAAGLLVGALSDKLARLVVGRRLTTLADRMQHVAEIITEATYTGDWSRCSPEDCSLDVDSSDELGEVAASFNTLVGALAASRQVESVMSDHGRRIAGTLDVDVLAQATLASLTRHLGAAAGALCLIEDGSCTVAATRRMEAAGLTTTSMVTEALRDGDIVVADVPDGVVVDAAVVSFRPAAVVVAPCHFKDEPVGLAVLAFEEPPTSNALRLLETLRRPTAVALHNAISHDRFQRLAAIDPLTGAYNRRFGMARLKEEFARSLRSASPIGVLMFDLDHFKEVNDTHGHLAGDHVLRDVASVVREGLREGDVLIRLGGEEFVVLLPGAGTLDVATIGERLRRTIATSPVATTSGTLTVTASFGGISYPDVDVTSHDELTDRADRAMYESKDRGRDRLTMARPGVPARETAPVA